VCDGVLVVAGVDGVVVVVIDDDDDDDDHVLSSPALCFTLRCHRFVLSVCGARASLSCTMLTVCWLRHRAEEYTDNHTRTVTAITMVCI
jgi:hypothetical protein